MERNFYFRIWCLKQWTSKTTKHNITRLCVRRGVNNTKTVTHLNLFFHISWVNYPVHYCCLLWITRLLTLLSLGVPQIVIVLRVYKNIIFHLFHFYANYSVLLVTYFGKSMKGESTVFGWGSTATHYRTKTSSWHSEVTYKSSNYNLNTYTLIKQENVTKLRFSYDFDSVVSPSDNWGRQIIYGSIKQVRSY